MWNFLQAFFGERSTVTPEYQVNNTAPDAIVKGGVTDKNDGNLSEIRQLEKHYGELHEGKVIETTLQEILAVIPKKRARTDAYDSLRKLLERDYGVKLIITSRKKNKTLKNN